MRWISLNCFDWRVTARTKLLFIFPPFLHLKHHLCCPYFAKPLKIEVGVGLNRPSWVLYNSTQRQCRGFLVKIFGNLSRIGKRRTVVLPRYHDSAHICDLCFERNRGDKQDFFLLANTRAEFKRYSSNNLVSGFICSDTFPMR